MNRAGRWDVLRSLLLSSLRRRRRELVRLVGWSIVEAVPALLSGRLVAEAIDDGFLSGRTASGFAWLGLMAAAVLVGSWGTRQTYLRLAAVVEPFRDELVGLAVSGALRRSTSLPGRPADTAGVARLTHQVEIVREAYAALIMISQNFVLMAASALLGLFTLIPAALVLVLPPLLLGLGLFVGVLVVTAARQRAVILTEERIAETASTLASGVRDIVACGGEERVRDAAVERIEDQARATRRLARLTAAGTVALGVGGWLPLVLVLTGIPWLVRHGATTGAVLGALTYISQGLHPALQTLIRGVGGNGLWLAVTLDRILQTADGPGPSDGARAAPDKTPARGNDLELRGVTFGYGLSAEPVIRDLDLTVPDGDHLAVVGPSGIGKSTLAGLIAGMLKPQAGQVRLAGVPVQELDGGLVQRRVLIPQEAYVFAGTLGENLAYLRTDATPAQIDEAVDTVGLRPLVRRLGGYGADVEPAALSAGERQLVTLARAYLSPARLVILDEATCHLDPAAEARAERAFARRPGTLLVIAHRISSALRARRVVVLDGTRVLLGTHEELLASSPLYQDLVGLWESGTPPVPLHRSMGRTG